MAVDPLTAGLSLGRTIINKLFRDKVDEGEFKRLEMAAEVAVMEDARDENSNFRSFVIDYEGAAKDYKDIPFIGPLMMLIRGLIRPMITLGVMWMDFKYITLIETGDKAMVWPDGTPQLLLAMTLIVLIFWFGERILKNTGIVEALVTIFVKK